jgi:cytochrome c
MDSFEFNKMAGAFLGTLLFVMVLGVFSDVVFSRRHPAAPGYDLPAADTGATAQAATAATAEPLPVLLAAADPKRGETLAKPCVACHSFEKGGANKVGPPLFGVVGNKIASHSFAYSDALKGKGGEWTYENLNAFLLAPQGFAKGTKMVYGGERDAKRRADILAYLRTLADSPAPLPAP